MHHVLVVDGEAAICDIVRMALEADGSCQVSSATSAQQAISLLMQEKPDAAVVEAALPHFSGLQVASVAVELGIPVLMVTGEPQTVERLTDAGCPFVQKPFHVTQIIAETRALLDQATQRWADVAMSLRRLTTTMEALGRALEKATALKATIAAERAASSKPGDRG